MRFLQEDDTAGGEVASDRCRLLLNLVGVRLSDPSNVPRAEASGGRVRRGRRNGPEDVPKGNALAHVGPSRPAREGVGSACHSANLQRTPRERARKCSCPGMLRAARYSEERAASHADWQP
eukprot:9716343-Alexandrium_andersonii.AAC.1